MANSLQARKRARQAEKRRSRNASQRSEMRTFVKKVRAAIAAGQADDARNAFVKAQSVLDAAVTKGLIHKNTAARSKSRLNASIRKLAQ
ncbi:MAG: 30S ribosomal protein S20 [Methylococcales bacterium]|nr:30S ribosomal protein S20 [Methylococcales bacterium]